MTDVNSSGVSGGKMSARCLSVPPHSHLGSPRCVWWGIHRPGKAAAPDTWDPNTEKPPRYNSAHEHTASTGRECKEGVKWVNPMPSMWDGINLLLWLGIVLPQLKCLLWGELSGETGPFLAEVVISAAVRCELSIHVQLHSWSWKTELSTHTPPQLLFYKFVR